jgi:hypothetical protein
MKLGINVKEIAVKAAGHAIGGIAVTQVNKIKYLKDLPPEKQAIKGAIIAGLGYAVMPLLAKKMGKGTEAALLTAAGEGIGFVGTMILANAVVKPQAGHPAMFPTISGTEDGMGESDIQGLGMLENNYENVNGYEQNPTNVAGYEKNPMMEGVGEVI